MPYSNRPLLWLLSTIVKQLLLFFADLAPIFANSPTAWMVERLWTRSDKKLCMLWKNWAINYSLLDSFFFKNDTACFINLVIYGLHLGFMKQICEKHQQPFQKIFLVYFMASTAMRIQEKLGIQTLSHCNPLQGHYRVELLHREIPVVITGNGFAEYDFFLFWLHYFPVLLTFKLLL